MIKVSLICTVYNHSVELIRKMLISAATCLQYCPSINYDIVIVDNANKLVETDFQEIFQPGILSLHTSPANLGYCGGNNFGIKQTQSEYIIIVNPDIEFINSLVFDWMIGTCILHNCISGKLVGSGNWYTYASSFPTDKKYINDDLPFYSDEPTHTKPGNWKSFKYIDGSLMCFSRKLFDDIGGFDDQIFPGYFGENCFAFKAFLKGYKLIDAHADKFYTHNHNNTNEQNIKDWSKKGRDLFYKKYALNNWDKFIEYLNR